MKAHQKNNLAAKIALVMGLSVGVPSTVSAGIPVIDAVGLVQHVLNAVQSVQQTLQMIQSYQTQLLQLQNQIKNSLNPGAFLWDDADNIIQDLLNQMDTIDHYRNQYGSIDNYLGKFKHLRDYKDAQCLSAGCSREDMLSFINQQRNQAEERSLTVKHANDAMLKGLEQQQEEMVSDANRLRALQANAVTAEGQLEAIQHANQLASQQANQLLQIRGLLITQQSAIAASNQAQADEAALKNAAIEKARESRFDESTPEAWGL